MRTIDYNGIQKEIGINRENDVIDVYDFIHDMTVKYIEPIYPESMDCEDENPYVDLLFAMLEINNIEI